MVVGVGMSLLCECGGWGVWGEGKEEVFEVFWRGIGFDYGNKVVVVIELMIMKVERKEEDFQDRCGQSEKYFL